MIIQSKTEAQKRADRIAAFKEELKALEHDGVIVLSPEQRTAADTHHDRLMTELAERFDIDANRREKQLSLGMKIASFIGALGMAASVFFLFYQFWGLFSTTAQVIVLMAAPLLTLCLTVFAARTEKTGYFSKLCGLVSLSCFVLNLFMLGRIFNITPTENACLVWALFAFLLAYASDTRLLLAAGIISFSAFLSAKAGAFSGCYWIHFGERPENFFPAAGVLFALSWVAHHGFSGFREIYRVFSLLILFIPVLILANWGSVSYLPLNNGTIEPLYQVAGFGLSALAVWLGIRKSWPDMVHTGHVFFTVFLYTKFYDWWWDFLPKYLFFLLIGLTAVLMLLVFKRLRVVSGLGPGEVRV